MSDILNYLNYFWKLGYREVSRDVYAKNYPCGYVVRIDIVREIIDYGDEVWLGDSAAARFSQRNFVILECVDRLLVKGYHPGTLRVGNRDGCDISVMDESGGPLIGIRCRRWDDDEYGREVDIIKALRNRPAMPVCGNEQLRFLCVYASTLRSGLINYGCTIFPLAAGNRTETYRDPGGKTVSSTSGLFEDDIRPYDIVLAEEKDLGGNELEGGIAAVSAGYVIQNRELIRYIGKSKHVTIPEGVRKLRNSVFWDCPEIDDATLPDGLTSMGGDTFCDCINLASLTIPRSVSVIGDNPFANCPSLDLENRSPNFVLEDGALYDREKTRLIYYSMKSSASTFEIPDGVVVIGKHSIYNCSTLRAIIIPRSVAIVENNPFSGCSRVKLVNHSPNFILEDDALYDRGRTSILYFATNSPAKSFEIPEGVTTIQRHSFYGCASLSNLTIPSSVKVIGYNPFANCPSLSLTNNNPGFVYENGALFDRAMTKLIYCSIGNPAEDFIVPDTVRTIGRSAFFGCTNIRSVALPNGVERISKGAFANCTRLMKVNIPRSMAYLEDWAFYNCTGLADMNVPKSTAIGEHAFSHCNVRVTLS